MVLKRRTILRKKVSDEPSYNYKTFHIERSNKMESGQKYKFYKFRVKNSNRMLTKKK